MYTANFRCSHEVWDRVEVVGDVIKRNSGLVVGMVQEVLVPFRVFRGESQGQAHKLGIRADFVDSLYNCIVFSGVGLWRGVVFPVRFIQHLPIGKSEMVARVVGLTKLIRETALGVPTDQTSEIFADLLF